MRQAVIEEERKIQRLEVAQQKLSDETVSIDEKMLLITEIEQLERI